MEASESSGISSDLTSTVESLLTNNGHEKKISQNDSISVGDSTPSSSSDANMQASVVKTIQDDPISSTSDSLTHEAEMNLSTLTPDINFIVGAEGSGSTSELGTDTDFFTSELNMESMSSEKISEDVEDIANDLENLLGETTSSYNVICSNSDTVTEDNEVEEKHNIVGVENFADQDVDLNISVKPDIHDANVQLEICHDKNKIDGAEFTESICVKVDVSELNGKTDISTRDKSTHIATCANKIEEAGDHIAPHKSNEEDSNKDNILQEDLIENQEKNEELETHCSSDGNVESASHVVISLTDSDLVIEKPENNQEGLQFHHELILEEKSEESNKDQNKQLFMAEDIGSQLKENISEGGCFQEITKTEVLSEDIQEKTCIMPINESKEGTKYETESGISVFQETNLTDELIKIASQQTDFEKESSSFVELKENLSEQGEIIETVAIEKVHTLSVQDVREDIQLIPESSGTAPSLITTTANNRNITQGNTDAVANKELNLLQKEDIIGKQNIDDDALVSVQIHHEVLENNTGNLENQATMISNVQNSKDTSNLKGTEVSKSKIMDSFEPADNEMDVMPIEDNFLIDNQDEIKQDKSLQQNMLVESTSNKGEFEKTEVIDSDNQCEINKENVLQHSVSPNVSQTEDIINKMEFDGNSQNKEQSQQEESNFIISSDIIVQSEVNTELRHVKSQENQEIQISSDNVIPADTNEIKETPSQVTSFDDENYKCVINQLQEANEENIITVVPSKSVGEKANLVCDEAQICQGDIEITAGKSDTLNISDIQQESSVKDTVSFVSTINEQDSTLLTEIESATKIATSEEDMAIVDNLEICTENETQEKVIDERLPSPRQFSKAKGEEISEFKQCDDEKLMKNLMEEAQICFETTEIKNENVESLDSLQESNSLRELEQVQSSNTDSSFTPNLERLEVQDIKEVSLKDEGMKHAETPPETSQNKLVPVNKCVQSEKSDQDQSSDPQEVYQETSQENLISESESVKNDKVDQNQSNDTQELEMKPANIEQGQQEDTTSNQDQSNIHEVAIEQVNLEFSQQEDTISYQDKSNDIQEIGMEQVNIEHVQCQEGTILIQDQSNNVQEISQDSSQGNLILENESVESDKVDQDQSKVIQEVEMEQVNIEHAQCQEGTILVQDQSDDIQEVSQKTSQGNLILENESVESDIVDQDESKIVQEVGVEQVNIEHVQCKKDTMLDQDQSNDMLEVSQKTSHGNLISENESVQNDKIDQDQSNVIQEEGMEQMNTEHRQQEDTISYEDQSNNLQEISQEASQGILILENELVESDNVDKDQSNDKQEVEMEQVNVEHVQCQEGNISDQDQSNDTQEVCQVTSQGNLMLGNESAQSDKIGQEQSNDIQEVEMEQVNMEHVQRQEGTISDQDQSNDTQDVCQASSQGNLILENESVQTDTVDQDPSNNIQEIGMDQVDIEHVQCQESTILDQDQSNSRQEVSQDTSQGNLIPENQSAQSDKIDPDQLNVIQEVGMEQVNIEHNEEEEDTILDQDQSNDIREVVTDQVNIERVQCQESTISDQDQSNDIRGVGMDQVNIEHVQCQEGTIPETIQLEELEYAGLQQEANTSKSDILTAKTLENKNLEGNFQHDIDQDKSSTDAKQLRMLNVEQPVHITFEQAATAAGVSEAEGNIQEPIKENLLSDVGDNLNEIMEESQSVSKSNQMVSQSQICVEEVLHEVKKEDVKIDNIEANVIEKDAIKSDLKFLQESLPNEHVCEEQSMEVITQVEFIPTTFTESKEVAQDNYATESNENVTKDENLIIEASLQLPLDKHILSSQHCRDQNESDQLNTKQDNAELQSQNLLQIHQEIDLDKRSSETTREMPQSPQVLDDINETSELQNAISHIMDTSETIDDTNVSILHDASITDIINSSPDTDQSRQSELQIANSEMFYSPDSTDIKTSEVEKAISQIIEVSTIVHSLDSASELENAISHIMVDPEPEIGCDKTSASQNTITQIRDSPEILKNSKDEMVRSDILQSEIDNIHSSNQEINVQSDKIILEQINTTTHVEEEQETEIMEDETRSDSNDAKQAPEGIMQSIYTEPVVDLILEDMDDQLKMFESKSDDSIANMPNIGEVDVDTPKTFESQHIDLILPEETSLLNTDDIISEITPRDQDISENELKIDEMHANEAKDLNDVIAREIESLLELQTQNLTADASTAPNESGEDIAVKIENQMNDFVLEEKMPNASVSETSSGVFETSNIEDNKIEGAVVLQENVLHQSTQQEIDKSHENIDIVEENTIKDESKFGLLIEKENSAEVSSSSAINTEASPNREFDPLITSTESTEFQPIKELDTPLLIKVDTPITTVEENESVSQIQIIEVPTSEYSSKMSENQDLKMTIRKHKIESSVKVSESLEVDDSSSILKIYDPKDSTECKKQQKSKEVVVPKLIIKPIVRTQSSPTPTTKHLDEMEQTVPKLFIKNMSPNRPGSPKVVKAQKSDITSPLKLTIKPVLKPEDSPSKSSPKLTIKTIIKTDEDTSTSGPKITIKPIVKPPDEELCHSPKITIKPIIKPDDCQSDLVHSPRITIKPIPKPEEVKEFCVLDTQSPRITIKPVIKPEESNSPENEMVLKKSSDIESTDRSHSPRITIKPVVKPEEHKSSSKQDPKLKQDDAAKADKKEGSPKITIKPIIKPADSESESVELIDFEEQIKQERIVLKINKTSMSKDSRKRDSTEEIEKLAKIKLKFSKEGGRAQIVSEQSKLKRALEESLDYDQKRTKFESDDLTITPIDADAKKTEKVVDIKDDVNITPIEPNTRSIFEDPLEKIPVFEITPESAVMMKSTTGAIVQQVTAPAPRKRGRPRKVPLVVREEFKDTKEEELKQQEQQQPAPEDTGRPKRSCRGPSVRTTLGIRTRKPRGSGRGRGRGRGARGVGSRGGRQQRVSAAKLKLLKEEAAAAIAEQSKSLEFEDGGDVDMKEEPPLENVTTETSEIVLIEEETRMSADINTSRAQTPAKQVPTPGDVDDTQSSVQSTATTESAKARKGSRHEVHHEPEGEIISADQLTEYYWGGGGPFMLQEQVAQFLGIKSFKRKYPGIQRRTVDMQERDFIRESGLASEAMCDLGLTAVHSADILDILYSDFQNKYEEYCKHQRDRQAKDFSNKQKALSLAASHEKNKHDIMQQAVQSAASWNANFNKSRREERKACMDLQTFTVHYPKGRFKTIEKNKVGHYPVALVPGQYTDYYKTLTSNELSNLPLNTMLDKPLNIPVDDDSQSDGSGSDSDSSTSDSDSSSSDSTDEDCNICSPASSNQSKKVLAN